MKRFHTMTNTTEWKPIETAPHSGPVLIYIPADRFGAGYMFVAEYDGQSKNGRPEFKSVACVDDYYASDRATHWQALPAAPCA